MEEVNEGLLLLNLLLENLLVVLLSLSASDGRLSVLKSLSCFLILKGIVEIRIGTIFVNNGVLQVLLLLIGEFLKIDEWGAFVILWGRLILILIWVLFMLIFASTRGVENRFLCWLSGLLTLNFVTILKKHLINYNSHQKVLLKSFGQKLKWWISFLKAIALICKICPHLNFGNFFILTLSLSFLCMLYGFSSSSPMTAHLCLIRTNF